MLPGLDESRVDHLRDVLTQRLAPMRKLPDVGDGAAQLWLGQSKSGLFRVTVTRHDAPVRAADASAAATNGLGCRRCTRATTSGWRRSRTASSAWPRARIVKLR
jgi:hypothetical protein